MLKRFSLVIFIFLAASVPALAQENGDDPPPDFVSDGCSLFPDGNYRDCCVAHDRDYYKGGSCKERRASDDRLYQCVRKKGRWYNKFVAPIMWVGVRVLGTSFLPTPYRWGFGKKKKKKKSDPSSTETEGPETDQTAEPAVTKPAEAPPEKPAEPPTEEPVTDEPPETNQ